MSSASRFDLVAHVGTLVCRTRQRSGKRATDPTSLHRSKMLSGSSRRPNPSVGKLLSLMGANRALPLELCPISMQRSVRNRWHSENPFSAQLSDEDNDTDVEFCKKRAKHVPQYAEIIKGCKFALHRSLMRALGLDVQPYRLFFRRKAHPKPPRRTVAERGERKLAIASCLFIPGTSLGVHTCCCSAHLFHQLLLVLEIVLLSLTAKTAKLAHCAWTLIARQRLAARIETYCPLLWRLCRRGM